jgi:hypothetical protein
MRRIVGTCILLASSNIFCNLGLALPNSDAGGALPNPPGQNKSVTNNDEYYTDEIVKNLEQLKKEASGLEPREIESRVQDNKKIAGQLGDQARSMFLSEFQPEFQKILTEAYQKHNQGTESPYAAGVEGTLGNMIHAAQSHEPGRPEFWGMGGQLYLSKRDYKRAFHDYGRAIELGQRDAGLWQRGPQPGRHEVGIPVRSACPPNGSFLLAGSGVAEAFRKSRLPSPASQCPGRQGQTQRQLRRGTECRFGRKLRRHGRSGFRDVPGRDRGAGPTPSQRPALGRPAVRGYHGASHRGHGRA